MNRLISLLAGIYRHARHGHEVTLAFLRNRGRLWKLGNPSRPVSETKTSTSISDGSSYRRVVEDAFLDDEVFSKFRCNEDYFGILDHVSYAQAKEYKGILDQRASRAIQDDFVKQFSTIGSPLTFPKLGYSFEVAPTLFRYLKVASDLEVLFGEKALNRVGEIGIGFGGQVAVLARLKIGSSFSLYDLPEVNNLARKFIDALELEGSVDFFDGRQPAPSDLDLVVSNYAFSELTREIQDSYIESVLRNASAGYITWNDLSESKLDGYSVEDIMAMVPGAEIFEERPLTHPTNLILAWGHKRGVGLYKS